MSTDKNTPRVLAAFVGQYAHTAGRVHAVQSGTIENRYGAGFTGRTLCGIDHAHVMQKEYIYAVPGYEHCKRCDAVLYRS